MQWSLLPTDGESKQPWTHVLTVKLDQDIVRGNSPSNIASPGNRYPLWIKLRPIAN